MANAASNSDNVYESNTGSPTSDDNLATRATEDSSSVIEQNVYMSMVWQNQKIGVAYYDTETMLICMIPDTPEIEDFNVTNTIFHQIAPSCIILSTKQDERLTKHLETLVQTHGQRNSIHGIQPQPSVDFAEDLSRNRIIQLNLPSLPKHYLPSERYLYISSLVPFENSLMVRATGALIKYLNRMRVGIELENHEVDVPILGLKLFSLSDIMLVNEDTISSLQIFKTEFHPSVYKVGQGKEGLSVFGIMNRCKSSIGSKRLRMWFKQPLRNKIRITERLDAISYFLNPHNIEATSTIQQCIRHIKPLARVITQMIQTQATINDWISLHKTTYNACCIAEVCRQLPQDIYIFKQITQHFTIDLNRIDVMLTKIVDFETSKELNRFVVKQNVDEALDEKKRLYHGLPSFLNKVAEKQLTELSNEVTECTIVYLPQLGYLLAVPIKSNDVTEENLQISGLTFVFHSNNTAHYRSPRTDELNTKLGDILCEIIDIETTIMHRLQNTIVRYTAVLQDVMQYVAELDCIQALASCANEYNYTKPQFNDQDTISITAGRHPLQELCCSPFVPNDTSSGGNESRIKILTGPNSSGKSVYIKQVGLIVYLAHLGCFVPAEHANVPICKNIFTRIKSLDSVSTGLSTFMLDLNQISTAIREATRDSVVLIDEFGKGTEMVDGLAILSACVHHWLSQEHQSPHVFVCTHFHDISQPAILPESPLLTYQTMETIINDTELLFLYQVTNGQAQSSFASHAALAAGLSSEMVDRANEIQRLRKQKLPIRSIQSVNIETYMERCHLLVDKFLQLDLDKDDVHTFLKNILPSVIREETDNEV